MIGRKPYTEHLSSGMDSFNQSWIAPGDSILFDVPVTSSHDDSTLYVSFNYEWEFDEKGLVRIDSVEHRVVHSGLSTEDVKVQRCN
jgi:hypothetical protein